MSDCLDIYSSPVPSKVQPLSLRESCQPGMTAQYSGQNTQSISADISKREYCTGTSTHSVGRMSVLGTLMARHHAHDAAATKQTTTQQRHNTVHLNRGGPQAGWVVDVVDNGKARTWHSHGGTLEVWDWKAQTSFTHTATVTQPQSHTQLHSTT
jgi:hypothetical protein